MDLHTITIQLKDKKSQFTILDKDMQELKDTYKIFYQLAILAIPANHFYALSCFIHHELLNNCHFEVITNDAHITPVLNSCPVKVDFLKLPKDIQECIVLECTRMCIAYNENMYTPLQ